MSDKAEKKSSVSLQSGDRNSSSDMDWGLGTTGFTIGLETRGPDLLTGLEVSLGMSALHNGDLQSAEVAVQR